MFRLGQHVTVEEFYKYAPLGMELSKTVCDDDECYCGSGEYEIILRYSLTDFHPLTSTATTQTYSSRFPPGLAPKPGFIWDSEEYGIEQLYSWTSIHDDFIIHKLPTIRLLKRKTT